MPATFGSVTAIMKNMADQTKTGLEQLAQLKKQADDQRAAAVAATPLPPSLSAQEAAATAASKISTLQSQIIALQEEKETLRVRMVNAKNEALAGRGIIASQKVQIASFERLLSEAITGTKRKEREPATDKPAASKAGTSRPAAKKPAGATDNVARPDDKPANDLTSTIK